MYTGSGQYYTGLFVLDHALHTAYVNPNHTAVVAPNPSPILSSTPLTTSKPLVPSHPLTDPDLHSQNVRVPLNHRKRVVHWVPPAVRHAMEGPMHSGAILSDSAFQHWWNDVVHGPMSLLEKIFITTRMSVGWVVWNYTDWVQQFSKWDGTWRGLVLHTHILWRTVVVGLLTLGILEIAPLLELLTRWVGMMFELIRVAFHLVTDAVEELWYLFDRIYTDLRELMALF